MNFVSSITLQFRDAFSSGFASAQNSFAGMTGALSELNQNQSMNRLAADISMAAAITDPFRQKLSALMDEPSKLAGTFESSMKNIQAITGQSSAEINTLGNELAAIGGGVAAGPLAVAEAYNDVAGGITNITAQMPVLQNAIALAEAGQADLGVATNGLVKIMNSYGFSVSNAATEAEQIAEINGRAAWASDVLTQAVGMGVGRMDEFVTAMAPVSGMAASVGLGFDEVGSNMAYITSTIGSASEAGTMAGSLITALLKPNKDLTEILQSAGISSGSAMLAQYGLAESASILSRAVGGNQDALTQALGRQEAMKAAVQLSSGAYADFAAQFGSTMQGITAASQAVQAESYESKVGRLNAATDALKIQIGGDINAIKGFFVDMGAGFLSHVVAPIMSSPVGGVFQGMAAVTGLAAKTVLDLGSGALNTASQLVVMTATIQNAGGFSKLFGSALGGIASPLKNIGTSIAGMVGPLIAKTTATFAATAAEIGFAGAMWATAGAVWAATWPILAVVAGVAALAFGGYMLVKHWDAVSAFFVNLWNTVTGAFSAAFDWIQNLLGGVSNKALGVAALFAPFIGIPALVIKNWETIAAFFVGLWSRITALFTAVWTGIKNFFAGLWLEITATFASAWNSVLVFFNSVWTGITQTAVSVANWLGGVWDVMAGKFAGAWIWIKDLFASVWESIKGVVLGFVEWLSPVIDVIIAPFKAIGNVIGGIIGAAGGWFGETVELGKSEMARMGENKAAAAASPALTAEQRDAALADTRIASALGLNNTAPVAGNTAAEIAAPSLATTSAITPPAMAATVTSGADALGGAGNSLLNEHLAAASRKGIAAAASGTGLSASDAFMAAGAPVAPALDMAEFENEARIRFQEAMPPQGAAFQPVRKEGETKSAKPEPRLVKIENLYLQADDCLNLFNFVRQLEHAVFQPVEAAV